MHGQWLPYSARQLCIIKCKSFKKTFNGNLNFSTLFTKRKVKMRDTLAGFERVDDIPFLP